MLHLPADVLDALAVVRRMDPGAVISGGSAAALHLGRPLRTPVSVATRADERSVPASLRVVAPVRSSAGHLRVEGIRVLDLEATLAALAEDGVQDGTASLVALLATGSTIEARPADPQRLWRAASRSTERARRRLAWWRFRLDGRLPATRTPAGPVVPLDPDGGIHGVVVAPFGLRVNRADGLQDPQGLAAGLLAAPFARDRAVHAIAAAFQSGLALEPGSLPSDAARALRRLESAGLLEREGRRLRPRAPFDGACTLLARACAPSGRRALLESVAQDPGRPDDPDGRIAAAHALCVLGRPAAAVPRVAEHEDHLATASVAAIERLLAVDGGRHAQMLTEAAPALLARVGRWSDRLRVLTERIPTARGRARAALLVHAAESAWRADRVSEASRLVMLAERSRQLATADRLAAQLLRATLAFERGAFDEAGRVLDRALAGAQAADDRPAQARVLHRMGNLAARRGRFRDAYAMYEVALENVSAEDRALRGTLFGNSAAMCLWTGRLVQADRLVGFARREREAAGTPAEQTATRVLQARIDAALGRPVPPGGRLVPLALEASQTGGPRLAAEVWLDAVGELAAAGRHDDADEAAERARKCRVVLGGAEPTLRGLFDEAEGIRRTAVGDLAGAALALENAVAVFERLGAAFYAARARRRLASVLLRQGHTRRALRAVSTSLRACLQLEMVLEDATAHAPVLVLAALKGDDTVRAAARSVLDALPPDALTEALEANARPDLARRYAAQVSPTVRAATALVRGHTRDVDEPGLARLRDGSHGGVVVDLVEARLLVPGRRPVPLARRRILVPLLTAIAAASDGVVTVEALAQHVWQRRPTASARLAVKVGVSRLRALLGAYATALESTERDGRPAYRWDTARCTLSLVTRAPTGAGPSGSPLNRAD